MSVLMQMEIFLLTGMQLNVQMIKILILIIQLSMKKLWKKHRLMLTKGSYEITNDTTKRYV